MTAVGEPDVNPIPADVRALLVAAEPVIIADAVPPPTVPLTYPGLVTALTRVAAALPPRYLVFHGPEPKVGDLVAVYELVDGAYRLLEGDHRDAEG